MLGVKRCVIKKKKIIIIFRKDAFKHLPQILFKKNDSGTTDFYHGHLVTCMSKEEIKPILL